MKRIQAILLIIWSICFYSCKDTNSAEATAEKFIFSMARLDMESARGLATKDTWRILKIFDVATKDMTIEEKDAMAFRIDKFSIIASESINDSIVIISYETQPEFKPFPVLKLIRQQDNEGRDRWKVDISSLDSLSNDSEKIIEEMKAVED